MSEEAATPVVPAAPVAPAPPPPAAEGAPPAEPPKEERVSPRLAAAIKKEKEAVAKALALKDQEGAFAQRVAAAEAKERELAQKEAAQAAWERAFKENPKKAIEERGITYSQLTEMEMAGQVPPEIAIKQVKEEFEAYKKAEAEERVKAAKAAEDMAVRSFQGQIAQHVEAGDYPYLKAYGAQNLVYATIDEQFSKTGKQLGIDEAAKIANAYVEAQHNALQAKLAPKAPPPVAPPEGSGDAPPSPAASAAPSESQWGQYVPTPRNFRPKPSLSNAASAQTPSGAKPQRPLTVEEWVAKHQR